MAVPEIELLGNCARPMAFKTRVFHCFIHHKNFVPAHHHKGMTLSPFEHQRLTAFRASTSRLVLQHARVRVNGAVASQQTVRLTHEVAMACCNELWELGFKLQDIQGLQGKHVRALVQSWYARGLTPKTIQNQISRVRRIAAWIGRRMASA